VTRSNQVIQDKSSLRSRINRFLADARAFDAKFNYAIASEVLHEGLRLIEQRAAEDALKPDALRRTADVGFGALDRGEFKEFESIDDLQVYLNDFSGKVISRAGRILHDRMEIRRHLPFPTDEGRK
jgi:antitoxin ParD1/3/4